MSMMTSSYQQKSVKTSKQRAGGLGPAEIFAMTVFFAAGILLLVNLATGCAAFTGQNTCKAIDLVNQACPTIVEFIGQDGGKETTSLSREDAIGLKRDHDEKAAAARRDAGAK